MEDSMRKGTEFLRLPVAEGFEVPKVGRVRAVSVRRLLLTRTSVYLGDPLENWLCLRIFLKSSGDYSVPGLPQIQNFAKNQSKIPESWHKKTVLFLGTVHSWGEDGRGTRKAVLFLKKFGDAFIVGRRDPRESPQPEDFVAVFA